MKKIFLLSPASTRGKRAQFLFREQANFELAVRLREQGASLAEIFSFLSGLYFRGKLAYATTFNSDSGLGSGGLVITAGLGLLPLSRLVDLNTVKHFSNIDISCKSLEYLEPLKRDLSILKSQILPEDRVILLGSVATGKYVEPMLEILGDQLYYPLEFKGLGDMSRGSLMLKAARSGTELKYQSLYPHGLHKKVRIVKTSS